MESLTDADFPVPEDEGERLGDLYSYGILDSAPEGTYDDLTRLAAEICGRPMAAITFIDADRQWVKAEVGGGAQISPRSESFCAHAIVDPEDVLVVEDATEHPAFEGNPYVLDDPELRFYAGAPIRSYRGHGLGTVCVLDTEPGALDDGEEQALASLSRVVGLTLELRRMSRQLRRSNEDLERFATAVSHHVGGLVHEVSASLRFVQNHAEPLDPEAQDQLAAAQWTTATLDRAVEGLERYARVAEAGRPMNTFALRDALDDARETLSTPAEGTGARILSHGLPAVTGDRDQIVVLLRNLLSTAIEHAGPDPTIHLTAHREEDGWRIRIIHDGPEIPPDQRDEMFSFLESGGDPGSPGDSVGLAICKRIVERHGGQLGVESDHEDGSTFWFLFPGPG